MKNPINTSSRRISALVMTLGLLFLAGCGSSSSGGSAGVPPGGYNPCVAGYCIQNYQNITTGYYAQSPNFPTGTYQNNNSVMNVSGSVTSLLAEAMGVCNRGYYNGGLADCNTWLNGYYDLVFMVDPANKDKVTVIFRAYPMVGQSYYTYNLPSPQQFFGSLIGLPLPQNPQGVFNPMILNSTINPVNNSQGFEIRSYGPQVSAGYNKLLQLQVASGKIQDERFAFNLFWNGSQIASGTLVKCQSPTCGL